MIQNEKKGNLRGSRSAIIIFCHSFQCVLVCGDGGQIRGSSLKGEKSFPL